MTPTPYDGIQKQVFDFLGTFKPLFSRAEYENFAIFILALLSDTRNKTVAGIARQADNLKDHTILSKFLQSRHAGRVFPALRRLFFDKADWSKPFLFYLDDTLVEKAGKKVRAEYNYSTTQGKAVPSNCFVVGLARNGSLTLPFDIAKYLQAAKPFKSKIDLAIAMMKSFLRWAGKAQRIVFVFDSWYGCKEIFKLVRNANAVFITRLKCNRKIHAKWGEKSLSLTEYAKTIPARKFKKVTTSEGKVFFAYSAELAVNKIGRVKVVFTRTKKHGRKTVFLVTNDLEMSAGEVVEQYARRWGIEQFFKELKNEFGFDEYCETRQVAVTRHLTLSLASYSLASLVKLFLEGISKTAFSIGKAVEKIRGVVSEVKRVLFARLYRRKFKIAIR